MSKKIVKIRGGFLFNSCVYKPGLRFFFTSAESAVMYAKLTYVGVSFPKQLSRVQCRSLVFVEMVCCQQFNRKRFINCVANSYILIFV